MDSTPLITMAHLIGLALGLGGAIFLDTIIMRFLVYEKITMDKYRIVKLASSIVLTGLALLWLSGFGFFAHYYYIEGLYKLMSHKLWVKLFVVIVLSLNGVYLNNLMLGLIRQNVGERLFCQNTKQEWTPMLVGMSISTVSWVYAFILGALFNFRLGVSAGTLLAIYIALIALGIFISQVIGRKFQKQFTDKYEQSRSMRSLYYIQETKLARKSIDEQKGSKL